MVACSPFPFVYPSCNSLEVKAAAEVALDKLNADRKEGYILALQRIFDARKLTLQFGSSVFYLTLDALETQCYVLARKPWKECKIRHLYETKETGGANTNYLLLFQVYGQCKVVIIYNRNTDYSYLYSYQCALRPGMYFPCLPACRFARKIYPSIDTSQMQFCRFPPRNFKNRCRSPQMKPCFILQGSLVYFYSFSLRYFSASCAFWPNFISIYFCDRLMDFSNPFFLWALSASNFSFSIIYYFLQNTLIWYTVEGVSGSVIVNLCPDCPATGDPSGAIFQQTALESLAKFNAENEHNHYFGLENVTKASLQWVVGPSHFVEYIIRETSCPKSTPVSDVTQCPFLPVETAQRGLCKGSVIISKIETKKFVTVKCDFFPSPMSRLHNPSTDMGRRNVRMIVQDTEITTNRVDTIITTPVPTTTNKMDRRTMNTRSHTILTPQLASKKYHKSQRNQ
ncbi:fetuin-B-like [Vipera latastei]